MNDGGNGTRGVVGRSPDEWQQLLGDALTRRDHDALRRALAEMRAEMRAEVAELKRLAAAPLLDRLLAQARQLIGAGDDRLSRLEPELDREREVWAASRERYRHAFVPARLRPFLRSSAAYLAPATDGVQFAGFTKWCGHTEGLRREAVTLFATPDEPADEATAAEAPPNFFTSLDSGRGELTIERAYRTSLPPGAGLSCIVEHAGWLVPDPADLEYLRIDDIQHRATYQAHVELAPDGPRLRPEVPLEATPLGRLARRIAARLDRGADEVIPSLDRYGILDLCIPLI